MDYDNLDFVGHKEAEAKSKVGYAPELHNDEHVGISFLIKSLFLKVQERQNVAREQDDDLSVNQIQHIFSNF